MLSLPIEYCLQRTYSKGGPLPSKKLQSTLRDREMCFLRMVVYPCAARSPNNTGHCFHQDLEKERQDTTITGITEGNLL